MDHAVNDVTPFRGRAKHPTSEPMLLLARFRKGSLVAEIRERHVPAFNAIEYVVFINNQFSESQMFHGARLSDYQGELQKRIQQFLDGEWEEVRRAEITGSQ